MVTKAGWHKDDDEVIEQPYQGSPAACPQQVAEERRRLFSLVEVVLMPIASGENQQKWFKRKQKH